MPTCNYCQCDIYKSGTASACANPQAMMTRDHVVPRASGGRSCVYACSECNSIKGDDPAAVFAAFLAHEAQYPRLDYAMKRKHYRDFKNLLFAEALHFRKAAQFIREQVEVRRKQKLTEEVAHA